MHAEFLETGSFMAEDRLYSVPLSRVGEFTFDDDVAEVFPDMIRRSVPGYASMLSMIGQAAAKYSQPDSRIFDLGCSLGAGTVLLRQNCHPSCCITAVDNSEAMVSRLRKRLDNLESAGPDVDVVKADIRDIEIANASVVVLNLTLQFLAIDDRTKLLNTVAEGTNEGGVLLLSEKICFSDPQQQQLMTELHHDFKRAHGYSDLEIAQKRTAIENRLVPETLEAHSERLRSAGYRSVAHWFQCFNFASIIAVK